MAQVKKATQVEIEARELARLKTLRSLIDVSALEQACDIIQAENDKILRAGSKGYGNPYGLKDELSKEEKVLSNRLGDCYDELYEIYCEII